MIFVFGEEDIIQPEAKPVDEGADGPDCVKKQKEDEEKAAKKGKRGRKKGAFAKAFAE